VFFPQADAAEMVVEAPPPVPRLPAGAQTVVVVEDAEGLRELAKRLLERQGYRVLLAANADEARELFERNPFVDVLPTDVVMPGASGPELTRRLVERFTLTAFPSAPAHTHLAGTMSTPPAGSEEAPR
jgi:two-component system cell cycle sensor histidine kinase/response regulator CckA